MNGYIMENVMFVKQVYMIDITQLPDKRKWYDLFGELFDYKIKNDTAFNIYWDEFGWSEAYDQEWLEDNPSKMEQIQEFRKLLTDAGVPADAEVWLNYWW